MVNGLRTLTWYKFIYTLAMFGLGLCSTTVVQWGMFYYAPPRDGGATVFLGAAAVGAAMAFGRLVDAWIDPMIGYFSDRTPFRLGRRKPFMAAGIPLLIISFVLFWFPPAGEPGLINVLWVTGTLSLFFISFSLYAVPYLALLPELAQNHEERVFLALTQSLCFAAGAGVATLAPLFLAGLIEFPYLPAVWAAIALGCLLLPLLVVSEKPLACTATASPGEVLGALLRNRPLLAWAFTLFFIWSGLCIIVKLLPFLLTFLSVELSALPWWLLCLVIGAALAAFFSGYWATRLYGIRNTFLGCLGAAGTLTVLLTGIDSLWRPGALPVFLWALALFVMPAAVLPVALQNAVTADLALRHRQKEGLRQEALLFAMQGLAAKLALATGALSLGLTLELVGYSLEGAPGIRVGCALAGLFLLAGAVGMRRYPETPVKAPETNQKLASGKLPLRRPTGAASCRHPK